MSSSTPRGEVLALLADIKENPRQDGLRLILADWLEECGEGLDGPRASLIRSQIEVGRLPIDDPARSEAVRQARWLLQHHGKAWLGPLADRVVAWHFDRGLLSVAVAVPTLRAQSMLALADSEAWAWVEELFLQGCDDSDVPKLSGSPLLSQLVSLGFQTSQIGPAGTQALGLLPWLARLEHLDLSKQAIGDRGLRALLRSPHLGRLRGLTLPRCELTITGCQFLADSALPVERLTMYSNNLGDRGAAILCSGGLPNLRQLDLRNAGIGEEGARLLAASRGLANLHQLILSDNRIGPSGAHALAQSPYLSEIRSLVLWGNPVGPSAAGHLQERFGTRVHVSPVPD